MTGTLSRRQGLARESLIFLLIFLGTSAFFAIPLFGSMSGTWSKQDKLAMRGERVDGILLETQGPPHGQVHYQYTYAGRRYTDIGQVESPNPDLQHLRPGATIYVTVDPSNPSISCACAPVQPGPAGERWFVVCLDLGIGLFMATSGAWVRTVQRQRQRTSSESSGAGAGRFYG